MYSYSYQKDTSGGYILYQSIGLLPVREVFLQPGDDVGIFLADIDTAHSGQDIERIIEAYF